jgi:hypothetical protein
MRRYAVTFHGRSPNSEEVVETGTGRTVAEGLRSAWARLLKSERSGLTKATIWEFGPASALVPYRPVRFALRKGQWVRVGFVEPNRGVKREDSNEIR